MKIEEIPKTYNFGVGKIILEIPSSVSDLVRDLHTIIPIITLNPFKLSGETLFVLDNKEMNWLILSEIKNQLSKLQEEIV